LNIGPAGVQADGTFGLYNSLATGDLANRFKWVIATARSQNPNAPHHAPPPTNTTSIMDVEIPPGK